MKVDVCGINAQRAGNDLREHGFVALAGRLRDGEQSHLAVGGEFDGYLIFGGGAAATGFKIGGDADAA